MQYTIPTPMKAAEAIRTLYPDSSRRTLQNWIASGRFSVDGIRLTRENQDLLPGQVLTSQTTSRPQLIPRLKVLYEDRYLVIVDKPVGLLSVPLEEAGGKQHALGLLREHYATDQIYAVHRIDRETSGCLLFARGKQAEERCKDIFERHDITREYLAIVEGRMDKQKGRWESNLLELPSYHVVESEEGKTAITHYTVLRRSPKYTYLRLQLETGRKHQIRVHCKAAGHPVLGDERYGSVENPINRMCLHAHKLELIHPFLNKPISFSSPTPHAFKKLGLK